MNGKLTSKIILVVLLVFCAVAAAKGASVVPHQVGFGECNSANGTVLECSCHPVTIPATENAPGGIVTGCYVGICIEGNIHLGMEAGNGINCSNIDTDAIARRTWENYVRSLIK